MLIPLNISVTSSNSVEITKAIMMRRDAVATAFVDAAVVIINRLLIQQLVSKKTDFWVYKGSDFTEDLIARNNGGNPLDLRNATITAFMKKGILSPVITITSTITNSVTGEYTLSLTNVQTTALKPGNYSYAININITPTSKRVKLLGGTITILN